ncbi:hypothetical protein F4804DRAFT_160428 [Jackrogersella minutella]|nr:hypothetical protein F4804DRAFT_160428 [Jackrogersella minutella]
MASRNIHLDATAGREVVYCHGCEYEWYRDERPDTLECPRCQNDATEIISIDNDPRNVSDDDSLPDLDQFHHHHHRHHHTDSDDEEDDDFAGHILNGPGGFFSHRSIYRSPDGRNTGDGPRAAPENADQIIRRFTELIDTIGGPQMRPAPETTFPNSPPRVTFQRFSGPGFSGGMSSFTITTGSGPARADPGPGSSPSPGSGMPGMPGIEMDRDDPFRRMFGDIMGGMSPPMGRDIPMSANQNGGDGNVRPQQDFSLALSQLIASLINPHMVHGDAVYSQEALDRIITNLMEANPQSNAPAPASDEAIATLPKKKLDEAMLGPELKGECTICIDDMKVGDEAVVLPCKHWFHEQCVVLWLKQHNTCPICRAPIDGDAAGRPSNAVPNTHPGPAGLASHYRRSMATPPSRLRSDPSVPTSRQDSRRNSNSPPMYSGSSQPTRVRSPSPSSRQSAQSERARDGRGSSSGGPLNWIRDQFRGDRRS